MLPLGEQCCALHAQFQSTGLEKGNVEKLAWRLQVRHELPAQAQ